MSKFLKYFLFIALLVFVTACPFEAPFPIDEPSVKYPSSLVGKWATISEEYSETSSHYIISDIDGYSFKIEENTYNEEEDSWTREEYSAHLSELSEYNFLNVYTDDTWYFYRMDWDDPDQFSLYPLTEYIDENFDSSEEMKIFFEKYCDLSFFYQGAESYMRID